MRQLGEAERIDRGVATGGGAGKTGLAGHVQSLRLPYFLKSHQGKVVTTTWPNNKPFTPRSRSNS